MYIWVQFWKGNLVNKLQRVSSLKQRNCKVGRNMDEGDCITKVNITLEEEVQNSVYQI